MIVQRGDLPDEGIFASLAPYGFVPSPEACEKIRTYIALLLRWNERISLTALRNVDDILQIHFGESIFATSVVPIRDGRLADVGTGAGFPGIPMKIAQPGLRLLLIEPNVKKCAFLSEVLRVLELDAEVIRERMDTAFADQAPLDYITSRAVGQWDEILKMGKHLAINGQFALWVGEQAIAELISEPVTTGLLWRERIKIPGTIKRFLLVGTKL